MKVIKFLINTLVRLMVLIVWILIGFLYAILMSLGAIVGIIGAIIEYVFIVEPEERIDHRKELFIKPILEVFSACIEEYKENASEVWEGIKEIRIV